MAGDCTQEVAEEGEEGRRVDEELWGGEAKIGGGEMSGGEDGRSTGVGAEIT